MKRPSRFAQIGPQCYLVALPGRPPTVCHRDGTVEDAEPDDFVLVGLLKWVQSLEYRLATLWGEECAIQLGIRANGRFYVFARRLNGECRMLEDLTSVGLARTMSVDTSFAVPF